MLKSSIYFHYSSEINLIITLTCPILCLNISLTMTLEISGETMVLIMTQKGHVVPKAECMQERKMPRRTRRLHHPFLRAFILSLPFCIILLSGENMFQFFFFRQDSSPFSYFVDNAAVLLTKGI